MHHKRTEKRSNKTSSTAVQQRPERPEKSENSENQERSAEIDFFLNMRKYNPLDDSLIKKCILFDIPQNDLNKPQLELSNNSWYQNIKNGNEDNKIILGILNKLNESNYDKLMNELKNAIILNNNTFAKLLFTKAIKEPGYTDLYVKLCKDLCLEDSINASIQENFASKKNNGSLKFMIKLYESKILKDIFQFADLLFTEITEGIKNGYKEISTVDTNVNLLIFFHKEIQENQEKEYLLKILKCLKNSDSLVLSPRTKFMLSDAVK
jgi:hypothetical protein